uniref:Major facilitator superfamily (MFS) profile domain-containing protein n=1 Tax=Daucus carota subsp. sativus TaxID=79200 RepID=A0A161ZRP2_DAUCS
MGRESRGYGDESSSDPLLPGAVADESFSGEASATVVVVFSTLVAVSGSYVFGSAIGFSSPAQTGIMDDLGLTLAEYSLFGSIMTIGAMLGAVMSGKLADLFGRRGAMGFSEMFCLLGWAGILFSKGPWWLDCGRLSIGYGVGLLSYVFMICCGVSAMYLVGNFISWRILTILGIVPCVLHLLGLLFIPESPRWLSSLLSSCIFPPSALSIRIGEFEDIADIHLAKIGREKDSESALQRLRGKNADISAESAEIRDYIETLQQLSDTSFLDLFQRKYSHSLIVGVGLMVLQQLGGVNGITYYASAIFISAGFSSRFGTIGMVFVQISAAGTCLGCFFVGSSFLLQIFTGSFSLGMGGIPWVIMSEIFPINIKGPAGSLVTVVNWFGTWVISYAFNFLMDWSSEGTFFTFSVFCGLTIVFVAKLVPETKGRTLEEIQASLN